MGRRRTHSRDEFLAKAMEIFREKGFAATSAEILVDEIGGSRYSLYSEFGSMQGLFQAALDRYNDEIIEARFGPLERPEAGLAEVFALLRFYAAAGEGPGAGRGCLLCNTAVEFGPRDPTGSGTVQRYFQRLSGAFRNALGNAQKRGDMMATVDTGKEADLLTSVLLGIFVLVRAKAPPDIIRNAADRAREHLQDWAT